MNSVTNRSFSSKFGQKRCLTPLNSSNQHFVVTRDTCVRSDYSRKVMNRILIPIPVENSDLVASTCRAKARSANWCLVLASNGNLNQRSAARRRARGPSTLVALFKLIRTYAKLSQQGATTTKVRTARLGAATPLGRFCVRPKTKATHRRPVVARHLFGSKSCRSHQACCAPRGLERTSQC